MSKFAVSIVSNAKSRVAACLEKALARHSTSSSATCSRERLYRPPKPPRQDPMTISRRNFNHDSLVSLLTAATAMSAGLATLASAHAASGASPRRNVIKQELPGEPPREITLVEVTYPPGGASPPHLHAKGVMAFVVSGTVTSKVGDAAEQTFHAGDAWWEPPGAVHSISRNASTVEPATLLAIYISPKGTAATDLMKPI